MKLAGYGPVMILQPAFIAAGDILIIGLIIAIFILLFFVFKIRKLIKHYEDKASKLKHETDKGLIEGVFYAQSLQQSILPGENTIKEAVIDCFILNMPKDLVSGDFYWFRDFGGFFIIAVIDCTGHGIAGGFMSMIGSTLLNRIIVEKGIYSPSEILVNLDKSIHEMLGQKSGEEGLDFGMELSICRVNREMNNITFAGAHRPLVYLNDGKVMELKGIRRPVGGRKRKWELRNFENQELNLQEVSSIYLFTDGLPDQNDNQSNKFGKRRLYSVIENYANLSMTEQKYKIISDLNSFRRNTMQRDDILLVGIRL